MEENPSSSASQLAAEPADGTDGSSIDKHQLIVFKLGAEEYAIHIDQIKEVVLTPRVTRMPQTPGYVKGVTNIRGSIMAIVDLEEKFGIQTGKSVTEENAFNYTLVAESKELNVGILVKEVPNTLTVMASDIDETINVVQDTAQHGNYILGIVKIEERLVILIDLFQIMQTKDLNGVLHESLVSQ